MPDSSQEQSEKDEKKTEQEEAEEQIQLEKEVEKEALEAVKLGRVSEAENNSSAAVNGNAATTDRNSIDYIMNGIKKHSQFVPMRLTFEERKLLRLLEAALNVSEYTDRIDILSYTSKTKRIVAQLREMCTILTGLAVATNMEVGGSLMQDQDFAAHADWYKAIFEIGRRYKIMNPEKMRDSFGKLMYMIMDSRLPEVSQVLEFDLYKPITTVYGYIYNKEVESLNAKGLSETDVKDNQGALAMFEDPLIVPATMEIIPGQKARITVQNEIKKKEAAINMLARKYGVKPTGSFGASFGMLQQGTSTSSDTISQEEIRQCLYSIGDYNAYLRSNRQPVEEMLKMLQMFFEPSKPEGPELSLGISVGRGTARLSHTHNKQFHYVQQSLSLWSLIMKDMFQLWSLADEDLLSTTARYTLADTGQGLNRVKPCPRVGRAMHSIIAQAMDRNGTWIGSSVVHLGDRTVPNALFFLDKYLQVPRILTPVYIVVKEIDKISRDPFVYTWIESQFGSVIGLKKSVLADFFKFAFDGSGGDNFYDAGSCIDGRLTSAWNWANSIAKKPYYKVFLVAGFTSFNGSDGF